MKVTKVVYDNVKEGKPHYIGMLSKRTISNIKNSKDYNEYRRKYCVKKTYKNIATINDVNDIIRVINVDVNRIEEQITEFNHLFNRVCLIQLLVTVIGFTVIIALIAW